MNKKLALTLCGSLLLLVLYFFGRTEPKKINNSLPITSATNSFNIERFVNESKKGLSPSRVIFLAKLENSIKRGDLPSQQIRVFDQLASFWKDSIKAFEPFAWYLAESAKLDKSEKNLTFAARLISGYLRGEQDQAKRTWMTDLAIELYEKVAVLNPADSVKVEMGACYIYGYAAIGRSDKAMKGVFMLRDIAEKDTSNQQANMLVGIGGVISGQYDKAIVRLKKVVNRQPDNIEAISWLADAFAGISEKAEAIKWYTESKRLMNNPQYSKTVDERIRALK